MNSISHRLLRCRYSNSRDLVASSPSFSRPVARAPQRACSQTIFEQLEPPQKIFIPNHGQPPYFNPLLTSEIPKMGYPLCPRNSIIVNPPSTQIFHFFDKPLGIPGSVVNTPNFTLTFCKIFQMTPLLYFQKFWNENFSKNSSLQKRVIAWVPS